VRGLKYIEDDYPLALEVLSSSIAVQQKRSGYLATPTTPLLERLSRNEKRSEDDGKRS
jgi:hypothetical protein